MKPTEHHGVFEVVVPRHMIAPARIVQSHAERDVQPASGSALTPGSATTFACGLRAASSARRACATATTTLLALTSMPTWPLAAWPSSPWPARSAAASASSAAALLRTLCDCTATPYCLPSASARRVAASVVAARCTMPVSASNQAPPNVAASAAAAS